MAITISSSSLSLSPSCYVAIVWRNIVIYLPREQAQGTATTTTATTGRHTILGQLIFFRRRRLRPLRLLLHLNLNCAFKWSSSSPNDSVSYVLHKHILLWLFLWPILYRRHHPVLRWPAQSHPQPVVYVICAPISLAATWLSLVGPQLVSKSFE